MTSSHPAEAKAPSFEVCIELLQGAKNDNEKLASLMLVPRLLTSSHLQNGESKGVKDNSSLTNQAYTVEQKSALLEAIGFPFVKRLLTTGQSGQTYANDSESKVKPTSDSLALVIVGLSVTSCFTEQGILDDTQLAHVVTSLESILLNLSDTSGPSEPSQSQKDATDLAQSEGQIRSLCIEVLEGLSRDQNLDFIEKYLLPTAYKVSMKQDKPGIKLIYT